MEELLEDTTTLRKLDRKPKERSVSYPGITIQEALKFTDNVSKNFHTSQIVTREDIGAVLKISPKTIVRDIAACVNYGFFLKQQKEGYQISVKYKTYTNALNDEEKKQFLLDAFKSPKLYIDLIKKFDGHIIPPEFKTHLIRFHKIAENAAPLASDIFLKNAKFCGILNEYNILTFNIALPHDEQKVKSDEKSEKIEEDKEIKLKENDSDKLKDVKKINEQQLLLSEMNNAIEKKVLLSEGKFAYWKYPNNLNKKDIEIFKKEIEILELILP